MRSGANNLPQTTCQATVGKGASTVSYDPKRGRRKWSTFFGLVTFCFLALLLTGAKKQNQRNSPVKQAAAPLVVIDAGHGGADTGAPATSSFCEEKEICLVTAKLVRKYLNQLGYRVIMTRSGDDTVSLPRRVEIAKESQSNIFVSIHYNSSRPNTAKGVEVFFYDSKEDKARAKASQKLAESVLSRVVRRTSAVSRGVKRGGFYVIREAKMPAVLIEGGFISNPQERALLKTREYQEKIARGIADGIDAYFKVRWKIATERAS
jgi:N-acetylmuramoyl-L-alanine amidase